MSKPFEHYEDPFNGVANEIVSAMSALNMPAQPIKDPSPEAFYLSETDAWANHAMEHLRAACEQNGKANQRFQAAMAILWSIGFKLPEKEQHELIERMEQRGLIAKLS